jgi:hypothetical protein
VFAAAGRWDILTYVENLFDVRYETGSVGQFPVFPGAPANFRVQVGTTF